jgi:hypothetical protein
MRIIPIIESQINNILILGYEPAAIQIHEEIFDEFIEECKSFITTSEDKPAIDFKVARFMGLEISKINYSRVQFEQSKGFVAPVQVTVKTYHLGE